MKWIEKNYGYYLPLEIRLIPKSGNIKNPHFLKGLDRLHQRFKTEPDFENPTSLVQVIKQLNKVLMEEGDLAYKIPDSQEAVAQELLLYEMNSKNDLGYFTDFDYSEARFTLRIPMVSSKNMARLISRSRVLIEQEFGDRVDILYGGYIPLYVKMMTYITQSQITSFLIAFGVIFLIMALLFKSLWVMVVGILPNVLPVAMTLGIMGWTGIYLDIATVTIAAIAIGISVDDTIHFLFMYLKTRQQGVTVRASISKTILTSGRAMTVTSLLLIFGYMVLLFANVLSVIYFGLLITLAMLSALFCDLFILPSLLIAFSGEKEPIKVAQFIKQ